MKFLKWGLSFFFLSIIACQSQQPPLQWQQRAQPQITAGEKTGNGGYVDEDAFEVLDVASHGTATILRSFSNESILKAYFKQKFGIIPDSFTLSSFANTIENVRKAPGEKQYRDGRELMFDYDKENHSIVAYKPFFTLYSDWKSAEIPGDFVLSTSLKLIQEASHTLGFDQAKAKQISRDLLNLLLNDTIRCGSGVSIGFFPPFNGVSNDLSIWGTDPIGEKIKRASLDEKPKVNIVLAVSARNFKAKASSASNPFEDIPPFPNGNSQSPVAAWGNSTAKIGSASPDNGPHVDNPWGNNKGGSTSPGSWWDVDSPWGNSNGDQNRSNYGSMSNPFETQASEMVTLTIPFHETQLIGIVKKAREDENTTFDIQMSNTFLDGEGVIRSKQYTDGALKVSNCYHEGLLSVKYHWGLSR